VQPFYSWLALLIALAIGRPKGLLLKEALRLLPDLLRLLRRLATDATLPRGVRIRLWLLLVYLAIPIDLVPDFIPVLGYATTRSWSPGCCGRSSGALVQILSDGTGRAAPMGLPRSGGCAALRTPHRHDQHSLASNRRGCWPVRGQRPCRFSNAQATTIASNPTDRIPKNN
jgi:hypothetical protein